MTDGVAILVKIGLRPNGHADHPDWNRLTDALGGDAPEQHQIVRWMYDNDCGHGEARTGGGFESPAGTQLGMMVVTNAFADAAVAEFPGIVTRLTPAQAEQFYDHHHAVKLPEHDLDTEQLQGLEVERNLTIAMGGDTGEVDIRIARALDPDNPAPGKRRNKRKTFALAKESGDFDVVRTR